MNDEQYHQKSGTYVLPVEVFDNLLEEKEDLEKENKQLKRENNNFRMLGFKHLCEINTQLEKEKQELKGSLQTYEILLKANVEENKQLKEKLEKERNTMENLKVLIKKVEQMRKACYSYEQYREYWKKVLETLDSKGE